MDAATFLRSPVTISSDSVEVAGVNVAPGPGWLRRLAPAGWAEAMSAPGAEGASRAAAMSALAALARDERFSWLTPLDRLGGAENKPYQYRRAAAAGVPVPSWIVTTDPDAIPRDGNWVTKPLGPGSFIDGDGNGWIVPTTVADLSEPEIITRVPFILQRQVNATIHARIVTVGQQAWSATLLADELPLDWRLSPAGHHGFTTTPVPENVRELALVASRAVGVGYSAQDWIQDEDGDWWFIDLNPAGQWLFLPEAVATPVTVAIARHIEGRP